MEQYLDKWYELRYGDVGSNITEYYYPTSYEIVGDLQQFVCFRGKSIRFMWNTNANMGTLKLVPCNVKMKNKTEVKEMLKTEKTKEEVKHVFQMMCFSMQSNWFDDEEEREAKSL